MKIWLDTSFVAVTILGSNVQQRLLYDNGTTANITDISGENDVNLVVVAKFIVV